MSRLSVEGLKDKLFGEIKVGDGHNPYFITEGLMHILMRESDEDWNCIEMVSGGLCHIIDSHRVYIPTDETIEKMKEILGH